MEKNPDGLEAAFCYDGYQIVRGEFFAHLAEPSLTFNRCKIYVNMACLRKAEETTFVQILVNPETRKIAVRPCCEAEKDSFAWCTPKRKPRQIVCRMFFAKIMDLMDWNPEYRYKLLGKVVASGETKLFVFDLTAAVVYPRLPEAEQYKGKERAYPPFYPDTWKNQFGLPVEEHKKAFQINVFDKFAVFSVKSLQNHPPRSHADHGSSDGLKGEANE